MLGTLARAGAVLDLFTAEEPEWGVTAAGQRLGIGKSLAHDVLASLASIGLLQRVGHGRYRLGWRTVTLAAVLLRTSELKAQSRPVVRELVERQGLTVSLAAWDCGRILYIDRRVGGRRHDCPGPLPGTAVPLDGSAPARILLASRPPSEIPALWLGGVLNTRHKSVEELQRDLGLIRHHGWARNDEDAADHGCAVAAPVRDPGGDVAAAITVDVAGTVSSTEIMRHAQVVVAAASRITAAIRDERRADAGREFDGYVLAEN